MELLKNITDPKPNVFGCMKMLQYVSKLLGISYISNDLGCNLDSLIFAAVVMWYSMCSSGIMACMTTCGLQMKITNRKTLVLITAARFIPIGLILCIVKFKFSAAQIKQMLRLNDWVGEKNASFKSSKYYRRNLVITSLFIMWIMSKAMQLINIIRNRNTVKTEIVNTACTFMSSWPLMIFNWQLLFWMQVFSNALEMSSDKLQRQIINLPKTSNAKLQIEIKESISEVKDVLRLKEKIQNVYGLSIAFLQLQSTIWIIIIAYWNTYQKFGSQLIYLCSVFMLNIIISFLPHWVAQEISSEVS